VVVGWDVDGYVWVYGGYMLVVSRVCMVSLVWWF